MKKNQIPRRIIQFWDKDVPQDVQKLMQTWRTFNPQYEYHLYNDEIARQFLDENFDNRVLSAYDSCAFPEMKSDILRYAALYIYGGFYVDADESCISAIENVIDIESELVTYKRPLTQVWAIGFIGCIPRHPVLHDALYQAVRNVHEKISNNLWLVTGNPVFSKILDEYILLYNSHVVKMYTVDDYRRIARFHNDDLAYKEKHWSKLQKEKSIFMDSLGGGCDVTTPFDNSLS